VVSATRVSGGSIRLLYLGGTPGNIGLPAWLVLPVIFLAVAAVMALVAQGLARVFATFEPLEAYRLDILGSLGGIAVFSLLSFLGTPPLAWGLTVTALFVVLALPRWRLPLAGCVVILAVLGFESFGAGTYYSPYYKIQLRRANDMQTDVVVNGVPHQVIIPQQVMLSVIPAFGAPYEGHGAPQDVLIVGAGTGIDTAIALSKGARHVDAVEIDPQLVKIGEAMNPDRAYEDPRVAVYVEDGRAFLQGTDKRYDLVLYALPDSLTLVTGQAGVRLESYLFTREAVVAAKDHLTAGGTFALFGYFETQWMQDRMANLMQEVFGTPPCVSASTKRDAGSAGPDTGASWLTMLVEPPGMCRTPWQPSGEVVAPPTDDRPFPYLKGADIPAFYPLATALILLVSIG